MNKKKYLLINLLMSLTVLFAMLFQTVHSYEHIYTQLTEKHCNHKHISEQKQITHSHAVENNCSICHFTFSTYIPQAFQTLSLHTINVVTSTAVFYNKITVTFFKGSLFALRAPPTHIL